MAKYSHMLVSKTAVQICGAAYEMMAKDDSFFKMWPKEKEFVAKQWGNFIRPARESLTKMLTMDSVSQHMKDEILEALLLDRALPSNGDTSLQTPTTLN